MVDTYDFIYVSCILTPLTSVITLFIALFVDINESGQYEIATNATKYKAVILDSTSPGTEVLTFGIKDFTTRRGQRNWRYRPCTHGNTASFPFRIDTVSFKVTVENTLEDGEYRKCIELYTTTGNLLLLDNMVVISVISNFGKLVL